MYGISFKGQAIEGACTLYEITLNAQTAKPALCVYVNYAHALQRALFPRLSSYVRKIFVLGLCWIARVDVESDREYMNVRM